MSEAFKITNCDFEENLRTNIKYQPYALTEHGVLMLIGMIKSERL